MPLVIDRTTEADLTTLFDTDFIRSLTKYLGMDADTPSDDMPLSVNELLEEAISACEQEQWRFILPKEAKLLLPVEAFCADDKLLFLPLGVASDVAISYTDLEGDELPFTAFTQYPGEPIRLHSDSWYDLINDCSEDPYPISVVYTPGYTSYAEVPKSTVRALKLLVSYNFEFRGVDAPIPEAYKHHRNLAWLNNDRANKYIADDWTKVSPK
jgi:hypothetical protein